MAASNDESANQERPAIKPEAKAETHKRYEVAAPAETTRRKSLKIHKEQEVSPQQIIPLDDDDFNYF